MIHCILFVKLFHMHTVVFECLAFIFCVFCSHCYLSYPKTETQRDSEMLEFTFLILRHVYRSGQFTSHVHTVISIVHQSKKLMGP
jgi:hypothetical protein